jgi:uncharacterized protein (DUF2147 family)
MRRFMAAGLMCVISASAALAEAPPPTGQWRVQNGTAAIRVVNCAGALWGVIAGTIGGASNTDTDKNNPDPALRNRPIVGLPILIDMRPSQGRWTGRVYNAENGKTYDANIGLVSGNVLHIEGCVLGFLCGGENWTRQPSPRGAPSDRDVCSQLRQ